MTPLVKGGQGRTSRDVYAAAGWLWGCVWVAVAVAAMLAAWGRA